MEKKTNLKPFFKKIVFLCFLFIGATNYEEIEIKVDNLLKQMSVVSGQLKQLSDTAGKFMKCKSCQKKVV